MFSSTAQNSNIDVDGSLYFIYLAPKNSANEIVPMGPEKSSGLPERFEVEAGMMIIFCASKPILRLDEDNEFLAQMRVFTKCVDPSKRP